MAEERTNVEKALEKPIVDIDAARSTIEELRAALERFPEQVRHRLIGLPGTLVGVGAGLDRAVDVLVDGNVGPYAFMLCQRGRIEITQNAGLACGHSFHSGNILIRGDCGSHVAAYALGGLVAVHGRAGDFAAYGLSGGEVVIRSRCGLAAGASMNSGTLIIGNGAGEELGQGMTGGTIFVRGPVDSLADGVQSVPTKDADSLRLGLLLARAGLKTKLAEFQAFRPIPHSAALPFSPLNSPTRSA